MKYEKCLRIAPEAFFLGLTHLCRLPTEFLNPRNQGGTFRNSSRFLLAETATRVYESGSMKYECRLKTSSAILEHCRILNVYYHIPMGFTMILFLDARVQFAGNRFCIRATSPLEKGVGGLIPFAIYPLLFSIPPTPFLQGGIASCSSLA